LVHSSISIKVWSTETPAVQKARPSACPECGAASQPLDGTIVLHGHGLRERQIRGVRAPFGGPELLTIRVRRYACQRCGVVITVVPAAVAPRRLFDLATIAFALARWLADGCASRAVRAEVSPLAFVGDSARRGWSQLRRWADSASELLRPPRKVPLDGTLASTRRVLEVIAAGAPLSCARGSLAERAFAALAAMPITA
jgi:transposase